MSWVSPYPVSRIQYPASNLSDETFEKCYKRERDYCEKNGTHTVCFDVDAGIDFSGIDN
jgi:hypothetical protein